MRSAGMTIQHSLKYLPDLPVMREGQIGIRAVFDVYNRVSGCAAYYGRGLTEEEKIRKQGDRSEINSSVDSF